VRDSRSGRRDGASPSRLAFLRSKPYFRPDAAADRELSARLVLGGCCAAHLREAGCGWAVRGRGSTAAARGIVALAPTEAGIGDHAAVRH